MTNNPELWNEYRSTWKALSIRCGQLQNIAESGEPKRVQQAHKEAERARQEHNAARDRLAACISHRHRSAAA